MNTLLAVSLLFHLVATATWIGGLLIMTLIVFPEARRLIEKQDHGAVILLFLDRIRKRFHPVTNLSLLVLVVTGVYQMSVDPHYEGLLQFTNDWSRAILWKHIAIIGMVAVGAIMQWAVIPGIELANLRLKQGRSAPELARLRQREWTLNLINCALGVVVLIFTAITTAL